MNILDENIPEHQQLLLRRWRIPVRQIGRDVGQKGLQDEGIVALLHRLPRPTFFSRDDDFYRRTLCHPTYCLVCLSVSQYEVASFVRRFLQHPAFSSYLKRRGTAVWVGHIGMRLWQFKREDEEALEWPR